MTTTNDAQDLGSWIGRSLLDSEGEKIGSIDEIYLDDDTGRPEWLAVSTGLFGRRVSFVPLAGSTAEGDDLCSPWTKDQVKDAPHADPDGRLTRDEEAQLYRHYGAGDSGPPSPAPAARRTRGERRTRREKTDDAMTRSEEELLVGTQEQEAGRARLRKWVETERVSTTVPVTHDEVRVRREPVTGENLDAAMSGPEISEAEHEVSLAEEKVVANTEVVPKERVRLEKEAVTEEQEVSADLRKERIGVEGDRAPKGT